MDLWNNMFWTCDVYHYRLFVQVWSHNFNLTESELNMRQNNLSGAFVLGAKFGNKVG